MNDINWYGEDYDYIHLKFGDARKCYNFTEEFRAKHPKFCDEYEKYWIDDPTCQFEDPMQIVNYVDHWDIPIHFYYNYTDTPAKSNVEVKEYLCRERFPRDYGTFKDGKMYGWDGEEERIMLVTITAETETSVGNKSRAVIFRWEMSLEQLQRLNEVAGELVEDK